MEERALFQAILAAPHDDAPRLVYADWLDENADRFPEPLARAERARAEFIRLQCAFARLAPEGWLAGPRPFAPELEKRERRLFFQYGPKWRRAFPVAMSSAPFDRGFLRPARAVRPQEFLEHLSTPEQPLRRFLPPLAADSPARRFAPETGSTLRTCPLWDIHLFASNWHNDPLADHGQYADLLAEVGRSPLLERVGWLKVSFFRTPVVEFLRTGHFANVETLVLNCGPSSDVLDAVAENESFRSLRYVRFGYDVWALAPNFAERVHVNALQDKLSVANARHVPFGEMRTVLRGIVRDTPLVSVPSPASEFVPAVTLPQPAPSVWLPPTLPDSPLPAPTIQRLDEPPTSHVTPRPWTYHPRRPESESPSGTATVFFVLLGLVLFLCCLMSTGRTPPLSEPKFHYNPDTYKIPPAVYDLVPKERPPVTKPRPEDRKDFVGPWPPDEK